MRFFCGVGIILFSAEQHRTHVGVFETWSSTNVVVDFPEWWKAAFDSVGRVISHEVVTQHGGPSPVCVPLANLRHRFSGVVRPEDICTTVRLFVVVWHVEHVEVLGELVELLGSKVVATVL